MTVDRELFADRLPTYLTRFVGRRQELDELTVLSRSRLVTICGLGGAGKTRLAIELAKRLRGSGSSRTRFEKVFWAPLAVVTDPLDVSLAVAESLGLSARSSSGAAAAATQALRGCRALLVLDNCEHVAAACADLVQVLLSRCPDLTVITTSRRPLGLSAEQVYAVPPMGIDAVHLFVERAGAVAPVYALTPWNAEAIEAICRRLDGLPLAVELAAAWVRVLAPGDLLLRLERALDDPSGTESLEERHRSIRAVLDATWSGLGEDDRRVLTALGTFVGGFTVEAAEVVAGATLASLAALADRSLIQRLPDGTGGSRYQTHELVRRFAVGKLAAAPEVADAAGTRHLHYYLEIAERWNQGSQTPVEPEWDGSLAAEQGNLDVALNSALERGEAVLALRLLDAVDAFWVYSLPRVTRRVAQLERVLALTAVEDRSDETSIRARARALNRKGLMLVDQDPAGAEHLFRSALELFGVISDQVGIAASLRELAWARLVAGDGTAALAYAERSLAAAQRIQDLQGAAWSHYTLGVLAIHRGDLGAAAALLGEARAGFDRNGAAFGVYRCEIRLAEAGHVQGDRVRCLGHLARALELERSRHFTTDGADLFELLALLAHSAERHQAAAHLCGAATTWRSGYGESLHPERGDIMDAVARLSAEIRQSAFGPAYAAGERLSAEASLDLADAVVAELGALLGELPAGLTGREVEVLRLVAEGLNSAEIADRLALSPRTVHAHLRSIFPKLGVTSRTAAAHEAVRLQLTWRGADDGRSGTSQPPVPAEAPPANPISRPPGDRSPRRAPGR